MDPSAIIEMESILLRETDRQDLDAFTAVVTRSDFGRYSPFGAMTKEQAWKTFDWIIHNADRTRQDFWVVEHKNPKEYTGFVGYQSLEFEEKIEKILYSGFDRKYWGSKFPLMATQALCREAFLQGRVSYFFSFIHPEDIETLYIAQMLGCTFEKECTLLDNSVFLFSLYPSNLQ